MKPQETKERYIFLRAEGKSYDAIAQELHISKSTCATWERELETAIREKKQEQLEQLYETYYIKKNLRIKQLGETLNSINSSLSKTDFCKISPEKLLDFKLKYINALKEEIEKVELGNDRNSDSFDKLIDAIANVPTK